MYKPNTCKLCGAEAETGSNVLGNLGARCSDKKCAMHSMWIQSHKWDNSQIKSFIHMAVERKEDAEKRRDEAEEKLEKRFTWHDLKYKLDDISDGMIKGALVCGAWGVVLFIFGLAYGVTTGNIAFK